jgi:hypothetical protein
MITTPDPHTYTTHYTPGERQTITVACSASKLAIGYLQCTPRGIWIPIFGSDPLTGVMQPLDAVSKSQDPTNPAEAIAWILSQHTCPDKE